MLDVLQCVAIDPDRLQAAAWGETRVDRRLIDDLAALTREYWCLYHTLAPRTLLPATGAHLDLVCRLLEAAPLHLRRDLGLVAGEAAMLDGWLAFLVDDRRTARSRWGFADDLVRKIGDERLRAHVLIARSSLVSSLPHGGRGASRGWRSPCSTRRSGRPVPMPSTEPGSWPVGPRSLATNRGETRCLPGPRSALDLAGFRGNCALVLGCDREAAEVLSRAAGDARAAGAGAARHLERWRSSPAVAALDERLRHML
ncbi:MAG TPA: hypothetical protein VKY90_15900 [Candidatus Dormibacteraeota bacterium]|nr:hypothetical protein [Candidatus Dormibacteraeota bacterium]